ncbi:MAG: hypothetical protein Q4D74_10250, partial [Comamonadaceae bacterium]|nr:hypothetical protein [Comamonadaceae bacterium]
SGAAWARLEEKGRAGREHAPIIIDAGFFSALCQALRALFSHAFALPFCPLAARCRLYAD